jgi:hypothetical protein
LSWHNPRQPETFKENIPHGTSNLPMKKKVIRRLSILFTHNTPIHYNDFPLVEIVKGNHTKKATLNGTLVLQIFFQGK